MFVPLWNDSRILPVPSAFTTSPSDVMRFVQCLRVLWVRRITLANDEWNFERSQFNATWDHFFTSSWSVHRIYFEFHQFPHKFSVSLSQSQSDSHFANIHSPRAASISGFHDKSQNFRSDKDPCPYSLRN